MSAVINGHVWNITNFGDSYFGADLLPYINNSFNIYIGGTNLIQNKICSRLAISFGFVPKIGRYYFNNKGSILSGSGIAASYTYDNVYTSITKWSTGGFVDIDTITKKTIKGRFNFTAKGEMIDTATSTIQLGSFFAVFTGGSGGIWPGP